MWSTGTGTDVWEMFCACIAGDLETVKRLVNEDPSLVRCHYAYRTPLYFAVRENQIDVAAFLLEHGADPLSLAVNDSLLEICSRPRLRGDGKAAGGEATPACMAPHRRAKPLPRRSASATWRRCESLLDASPELLHAGDERSNQPIHWAVMTRQIDAHRRAAGARRGHQRATSGRRAPDPAHQRRLPLSRLARRARGDPTTPAEVLAHLIARGAYVDICTAAHIGDLERVRELLDQDPSLANRVSDYVTYYLGSGAPLNNAAAKGHIEIVKLLLERGADPNLPEEGIAPHGHALYSAVSNGHYEIAKLLLEHGAYPNPPVESSADALSIALIERQREDDRAALLVRRRARRRILLAHYGDVQTAAAVFAANPALGRRSRGAGECRGKWPRGVRPVDAALPARPAQARLRIAAKTRELTELLFEHGMNPSQPDWLGITPLHEFARKGDVERAALFIDHGADLHARDEDICSTPLGWAAKFGQTGDGRVSVEPRRQAEPARRSAMGDAAGLGDAARAGRDRGIAEAAWSRVMSCACDTRIF